MEKVISEKEKEISSLRKDLENKNTQISAIELRVDELENTQLSHKKHQEKRFKDLENSCKQKVIKEKGQEPAADVSTIQCNKCDYKSTSRQGLKIHNSKVRSNINFESR